MVNVMMLVAAKWREFSSQKPFIELAPPPPPPPPPAANTKKKGEKKIPFIFHFFNANYSKVVLSKLKLIIYINVYIFIVAVPTVEEVCLAFGLKDVKISNSEADDVDLTKYRSFVPYVRSILSKENPNVCFCFLILL